MSDEAIIELKNVSKGFNTVHNRPESLKSLLVSVAKGEYFRLQRHQHMVLDNVSFSIRAGERVGIMGRNGVGKSTLMRLLSGIYQPNSGQILVRGKVAPMVALGAGFHPDLSGYENIFLNGAIIGISRAELRRSLSAIVEFSELGDDIYKPIKQYSSGMVLRLGFSVASHVAAPILILDEVLGVGDEGFQKKCFEKLNELFNSGRTIVLVTHDPGQVTKYCQRCILLERGKIIFDGLPEMGADRYHDLFR